MVIKVKQYIEQFKIKYSFIKLYFHSCWEKGEKKLPPLLLGFTFILSYVSFKVLPIPQRQ